MSAHPECPTGHERFKLDTDGGWSFITAHMGFRFQIKYLRDIDRQDCANAAAAHFFLLYLQTPPSETKVKALANAYAWLDWSKQS